MDQTQFKSCQEIPFPKAKKIFSWDIITWKHSKKPVLVCEGSLAIKGDLNLDELATEYSVLVIKGDLKVSGSVLHQNEKSPFWLVVEGKTKTKNILVCGCRVVLWKDVSVSNLVFPYGNAQLKVLSKIRAKVLIRVGKNADYEGKISGQFINLMEPGDPKTIFQKTILKNGKLDSKKLVQAALENKTILI